MDLSCVVCAAHAEPQVQVVSLVARPRCKLLRFVHGKYYKYNKYSLISLVGNALVSINEVTLRRARLVLGWVTVVRLVNDYGMLPVMVNSTWPYLRW